MTCNLLKQPAFAHHRRGDERCIWRDISIWRGAIAIHVVDKRCQTRLQQSHEDRYRERKMLALSLLTQRPPAINTIRVQSILFLAELIHWS